MKKIYLSLIFAVSIFSIQAQQVRPLSSPEIYRKLNQLNNLGSVMYVAAHPDDENTRLLSYLVHHEHIKTTYLSLTRGDGGQNIIGNEIGSALGLIRTYELFEARKIDGAEQMFSSAVDFGYSKSEIETFRFWDEETLIKEVVETIQEMKPDIMICRFPTTGEGGHGQHTASAIIAQKAYQYIENYNKINENNQLWLPKRLLFNAFQFGNRSTLRDGQFKIPINQYKPLLGEGYGEMAGRSRSIHRSQGAGTPQTIGKTLEHFEVMEGAEMNQSLFDGIEMTWKRIGKNEIQEEINKIIQKFKFDRPSASIHDLIKVRKNISTIQDDFWRQRKLAEIDEIIIAASGLMLEALSKEHEVTPGTSFDSELRIISRSETPIIIASIENPFTQDKLKKNIHLNYDSLYTFNITLETPENIPYSEPYWMKREPKNSLFKYTKEEKNEGHPAFKVQILIDSELFPIKVPLSYKILNPLYGDVVNAIKIVPPVSIEPLDNLYIYEEEEISPVRIRLVTFKDINQGTLSVKLNDKSIYDMHFQNLRKGMDTLLSFVIPNENWDLKNSNDEAIKFEFETYNTTVNRTRRLIQYSHLPEIQYFTAASMKIIEKDWKVDAKKIGYIEGVGDYVDDVLMQIGLNVEMISENQLTDLDNLMIYDAIIMGVRALNTQPYLNKSMSILWDYVAEGGNLIIQYNTNHELVTNQLGPYPLTLSRDRVVEEDAIITITNPQSDLLNYPNKITSADFQDWVQERGLYYPSSWDSKYNTIFSMHDESEKATEGSVIYTDYGKGRYIYTGLSFFRQLPAGNKGAIRLFMNFLSPKP